MTVETPGPSGAWGAGPPGAPASGLHPVEQLCGESSNFETGSFTLGPLSVTEKDFCLHPFILAPRNPIARWKPQRPLRFCCPDPFTVRPAQARDRRVYKQLPPPTPPGHPPCARPSLRPPPPPPGPPPRPPPRPPPQSPPPRPSRGPHRLRPAPPRRGPHLERLSALPGWPARPAAQLQRLAGLGLGRPPPALGPSVLSRSGERAAAPVGAAPPCPADPPPLLSLVAGQGRGRGRVLRGFFPALKSSTQKMNDLSC